MHPVSRRILVKVAKLLQNVFNETGYEQDTTLPEAYQNFIRASIPKFHSVVFSITVRNHVCLLVTCALI